MTDYDDQNAIDLDINQICTQLKIRPEIYMKLVNSFVQSLDGKYKRFSAALAENDRETMRMILHEIKGTAGNLRLYALTGPESVLHVAVKAGENQNILGRHFEMLQTETQRLQKYLLELNKQFGENQDSPDS